MTKRILALILAVLTVLPLVGCQGNPIEIDTESGTEAQTDSADITKAAGEFLSTYSDNDAMNTWLKENIEDTDTPPVYFVYGSKTSDDMKWKKTIGEAVTVTDYPDSDNPVKRTYKDITYVCEEEKLEVTLTLTSYPNYPVIEYDAHLKNLSEEKSAEAITWLSCVNTTLTKAGENTNVHYNKGSSSAYDDYTPYTKAIKEGDGLNIANYNGLPTNEYMPYFNIENTTDKTGVVAAVNWQGNWFANYSEKDGEVIIQAGQNGSNFNMQGGESFKIPGLVLIFYKNGDWQQGQNIWRRWIIEHNLMRYTGRRDYTQNVFLCSGYEGFETDYAVIQGFLSNNIGDKYNCTFEIDAGWYQCGGSWEYWWNTGDYSVADNYPGDSIRKMADACKNAGVGFCLWMEPERFVVETPQANELGAENYLGDTGVVLINYGKQEAQDYVVNLVDTTVKTHGLTVYRQDFNTTNQMYWAIGDNTEMKSLGMNRTGATENHACEGYINAWKRIAELNPGLIFDSCAGGGRRNDLETVRFSFAHTKSDYWADVISQQNQNFGSLSWLIFTGTGFLDPSSTYDVRSRLTLSIGIGANVDRATARALEEWNENQKYMYKDFYQLTDFNANGGKLALQFNDYENGEGMMVCYLRSGGEFALVAKGLKAEQHYKVYDKDNANEYVVMTGEQLMTDGFYISRDKNVASAVIALYQKTDEALTGYTKYDMEEELKGEVLVNYDELPHYTNDMDLFVQLAQAANVSGKQVKYLTSDYDCSGGIYAIGKNVYDMLVKVGSADSAGWIKLDPENTYISIGEEGVYPLTTWPEMGAFDVRAYVCERDGIYMLWLDNTFGFGDADGSWLNKNDRRIGSSPTLGRNFSDEFELVVCEYTQYSGRLIQFACFTNDNSGVAYRIPNDIIAMAPTTDETISVGGIEWKEIDTTNMSAIISNDDNQHHEGDPSYNKQVSLKSLKNDFGINFYIGEKNGQAYIYVSNFANLSAAYRSDRWHFVVVYEDVVYTTEVYFMTGSARGFVETPGNLDYIFG